MIQDKHTICLTLTLTLLPGYSTDIAMIWRCFTTNTCKIKSKLLTVVLEYN